MINASILLKNKTDEHLNVFWQYDGKPKLENNITKAFINTIDSLEANGKRKLFRELFGLVLPKADLSYEYYLQKKPSEELIKSIPDSNKVLFAFSPTGKCWGYSGIDSGDVDEIKVSIEQSIREYYPMDSEDEIKRKVFVQLSETLDVVISRGGSIPDAWIFVYSNNKPLYCVAMENKLYDLDPFQLRNHCEKSLFTAESRITYCKYADLLETFSTMKGYLVEDFLRYMYFLNYWDVTNLSQVEGMDDAHIALYAKKRCKQLLHEVSGKEVTWHRGWMYKYDSDNEFNREVGLDYYSDPRGFEMPLYFASTQKSARAMYTYIKDNGYNINPNFSYKNSFHFQYVGTGKNVNGGKVHSQGTYYSYDSLPIERYIEFWIEHIDYIHQMGPEERHKILDKMLKADIIPRSDFDAICKFSDEYKKPLNICPEIGVFLWWPFEKAVELDKEGSFATEIAKKIKVVYNGFGK